ncbi:hypothetical protein OS493_031484 [Desmophyllum pertusum]|uniref:Uncharacterized protein n=1 Tax=Desmophyllum pertusum TaxID=174260 RepID=A0A9W9ZJV4_9CNID|nr:hypothetical protein OS493_031484 [Desmophyllum pertusum]
MCNVSSFGTINGYFTMRICRTTKVAAIFFIKIFDGNTNRYTVVSHKLKNPIITRYIRINPITFHGLEISLRADFYGCDSGFEVPKIPGCRTPLGMENGQISNGSITASSQEDTSVPGLDNARLHFKGDGFMGAWMPQTRLLFENITEYRSQWLQIEFEAETQVTGISTQGSNTFDDWVETYSLRYSTNDFSGNTDPHNVVSHVLIPPIQAQYIRVIPESWHYFIALRVEFYGCLAILAENGDYSQWSPWTECSVTCGTGLRSRNRSCTNPPPAPYGNDCSYLGSNNQTVECHSGEDCPHRGIIPRQQNATIQVVQVRLHTPSLEFKLVSGSNHTITYVYITIGILVVLALLAGLLIKYCLFSKKSITSPPEFKYHAFIIYSQEDSHWVNDHLLPFLEGRHHLKCCLHYRDFTPGKPFQESMAESVYNSYKIIAVLSNNFLNSNYCSYELNIAKYRLLNRRDESLIVIRIDKGDYRKLPRELRKRNFIDYSNSLERPLWESKLLTFLNAPDDSINQDLTAEQSNHNDTNNSNNVSVITSSRNEDVTNDDTEMYIINERVTAL